MDVDRQIYPGRKKLTAKLQWSHVLMDVDRTDGRISFTLTRCASMEPRPDGRG